MRCGLGVLSGLDGNAELGGVSSDNFRFEFVGEIEGVEVARSIFVYGYDGGAWVERTADLFDSLGRSVPRSVDILHLAPKRIDKLPQRGLLLEVAEVLRIDT